MAVLGRSIRLLGRSIRRICTCVREISTLWKETPRPMVRAGQVDKMEMRFWLQGGRRRSLVAKSGPDARRDHRGEARGDAMAGMKSMVVIEIVMCKSRRRFPSVMAKVTMGAVLTLARHSVEFAVSRGRGRRSWGRRQRKTAPRGTCDHSHATRSRTPSPC